VRISPAQLTLLEDVKEAYLMRQMATLVYSTAITNCVEAGISNRQIGIHLGLSEAAIRNWRKRNES